MAPRHYLDFSVSLDELLVEYLPHARLAQYPVTYGHALAAIEARAYDERAWLAIWESMVRGAMPMSDAGVSAEGWRYVDTVFHVDGAVIPSTFTEDAWL